MLSVLLRRISLPCPKIKRAEPRKQSAEEDHMTKVFVLGSRIT